ncbi:hypothetical protein CFR78_07875 [Komagataeibacter rhaeticus]|uniref:Uncharacterized protein n=1 Tax=Komagataeibacter rhaeticus TaxID=215221 RepID=A0A181CDM8_9PROT|nr:hypothetical protein [Komagataeibacter rhaeticus]ATU71669.1 hypothetical protein CT154_01260 [Komagataeibacter xylinus]EGG77355.1 hypothetical protein SXCC_01744 [Gluconacetobacter sp. SXCC-1]KDU96891.1 hypothetical protein GLUCORHAEAF1_18170 [Komagataeibacter rhaeticus AF1]MBL7240633.1 hypothetical protein [Komagataeibacter rhaeticus]PYD53859.1 hypothetical protein CFR78_07875 [Komagataeibacter rhaeticus]
MKPFHMALAAISLGGLVAGSSAARAESDPKPPYGPGAYTGAWTALGLKPVTITANKALGPAARLYLQLPDSLGKITGLTGRTIELKVQDGTSLRSVNDSPRTVFRLTSPNAADLQMQGEKPGQKLDLPLSRAD